MIPKIAHFHWEGPPITWLRMMGLYTFIRLNPRWEVRLHRTPDDMRARNLPCHGNEADWTWLRVVHEHGGFALATDTVFVRPMPDEWLNGDLCACTDGTKSLHHCCFGAMPGHPFVLECLDACEGRIGRKMQYEALGIELLKAVAARHGGVQGFANFHDMPRDAFTQYSFVQPPALWADGELKCSAGAVGITWFGGHPESRKFEPRAESMQSAAIVRLARKMVSGNE